MGNISLDNLPVNFNAKICTLNCNNNLKRRLLDLGLISGTNIKPLFISPIR
jgi:Fe2+ transport system protein FeoA